LGTKISVAKDIPRDSKKIFNPLVKFDLENWVHTPETAIKIHANKNCNDFKELNKGFRKSMENKLIPK
jgi:hypothetical protein